MVQQLDMRTKQSKRSSFPGSLYIFKWKKKRDVFFLFICWLECYKSGSFHNYSVFSAGRKTELKENEANTEKGQEIKLKRPDTTVILDLAIPEASPPPLFQL